MYVLSNFLFVDFVYLDWWTKAAADRYGFSLYNLLFPCILFIWCWINAMQVSQHKEGWRWYWSTFLESLSPYLWCWFASSWKIFTFNIIKILNIKTIMWVRTLLVARRHLYNNFIILLSLMTKPQWEFLLLVLPSTKNRTTVKNNHSTSQIDNIFVWRFHKWFFFLLLTL